MNAIIAPPASEAKRSPARQQAKHSDPVPARPTEAERLQMEALQILHYLCTELAQAELRDMPHARAEAIECDTVLFNLLNPEESDSPQIGALESLVMLRQQVQNTFACLEAASGPTVPVAIASAALLEHIDGFAAQLHPAIAGLPGTLEDLRALTTFAGIKTFRDRPTPPIRRVEQAPPPGKTHAQQRRVLEFVAQQAGTVNELLMQMQADSKISYDSQVLLGGAQAITQYIGAAADDALGGDIVGDFERWTYGPNFADAGKGASA
ncbi:hypothetical protein [Comamonas sp.]|uniref:hypothetical protein n=1 Tax=Comamonas sp. TaxID=34028 RepID=UPI002899093B|nr:hypothetical protein [Comamonas sp.]